MGYYRPVSEFNVGKKSEFYSRVCFAEGKALQAAIAVLMILRLNSHFVC
jgi:hypothetical protein